MKEFTEIYISTEALEAITENGFSHKEVIQAIKQYIWDYEERWSVVSLTANNQRTIPFEYHITSDNHLIVS